MPHHSPRNSNPITNHTAIHLSSHRKHKPAPRPRQANLSMHIAHLITRPSHGVQSALPLTNTKSRNKGMKHPPTTRTLADPKPYPHNNIYLVLTIHKRNGGKDRTSLRSIKAALLFIKPNPREQSVGQEKSCLETSVRLSMLAGALP